VNEKFLENTHPPSLPPSLPLSPGWAIFWKEACSPEVQQRVKEALIRSAGAGKEGGGEVGGAAPSDAEMRDALTGLAFNALLEVRV